MTCRSPDTATSPNGKTRGGYRAEVAKWKKIVSGITLIVVGVFPVMIGAIDKPWSSLWAWALVVAVLLALGTQAALLIFDPGPEAKRSQILADLADTTRATFDSMGSMARSTPGEITRSRAERYNKLASELRAALLLRHGRARVQIFLVAPHVSGQPVRADVDGFAGRLPRSAPFVAGSPRGEAALKFISNGQSYISKDVDKDPPAGWQGTTSGYQSFMSCPVVSSADDGLGMVTVDFQDPTPLTEGDEAIMQIFAGHIAVARSIEMGRTG